MFRHIHYVFHARIDRFNEIANGNCILTVFVQKHIKINIIISGVVVIRCIIGGVIGSIIMNHVIPFRT